MSMRAPSAVVHQTLDLPADRLAAVIGSWPEPAILSSASGFGDAGRWSIFTAYPRLVFEATDHQWTIRADTGAFETGEGDPLAALASLTRRYRPGGGRPSGRTAS